MTKGIDYRMWFHGMDGPSHAQHIPTDEGSEVDASNGQIIFLISLLAGFLSCQPAYLQRQH